MLKDIHEYKMNKTLLTQALIKFLAGIILTGLLVFLPAGSLTYWQGWLLIGILFVPMFIAGIFILVKSPELLRKRLNAKEKESEQKTVVALSGMLFLISFVMAGLNWKLDWWMLPDWAVWTAAAVFILSYILYAEVLRENEYLSRTIEIQEGQKVIDTGLWNCPSPDVYGYCPHVSINAIGPQFSDIIHHHVRIYSRDCQENQE